MHAMVQKLPVTIAIPVKNEEINLPGCLERLGRFEQVVVIDSGSTKAWLRLSVCANVTSLPMKW